jgi:hypothetical protein
MTTPQRRRGTAAFTNVLVAIPLVIGAAALAWVNFGPLPENPSQAAFLVKAGDPAPPLPLSDAAGTPVPLPSVLVPGAPTLVMVFSPECQHCHTQLRQLDSLRAAEPSLVPRLVLVSVGDEAQTAEYRGRNPGREVYDDPNLGFQRRYDLRAVPALLLVDGKGVVRGARVGLQPDERLRSLLAAAPPAG